MRRNLQWLVSLLISAVALWLAARDVSLPELAAALGSARVGFLLPAVGFVWLGQWLRGHSWRVILGHGISHRQAFSALNAGYLLNNVLPLRLGELGRAYLISRTRAMGVAQALSSVLVERVIDLCLVVGILLSLLPTLAFPGWAQNAALISLAVVSLGLLGLYAALHQRQRVVGLVNWGVRVPLRFWTGAARLETMAGAFLDGLQALQQPARFLKAATFSGLAWLSAGASLVCLLLAFLPQASVGALAVMGYFTLAVTALSIALPSAPGSLGVWQWAVVLALGVFSVPPTLALSVALAHHLANYGLTSLLGAAALTQEGESLDHLARSARALLANVDGRTTGAPG